MMPRCDLDSQVPQRRGMPSASAVPMVGASEHGGGLHRRVGEQDQWPDEVPLDQAIPSMKTSQGLVPTSSSSQWAPTSDAQMFVPPPAAGDLMSGNGPNFYMPPASAPPDPGMESGPSMEDPNMELGLRRRVAPSGRSESEDGVPSADAEASGAPRPGLRPEGAHGAPPPAAQSLGRSSGDDDERKKRARGGKVKEKEDPRVHRLDVLERALKEKNEKIAELEQQVAMGKSHNETKQLLRSSSGSSSNLGGRSLQEAETHRAVVPRGRGQSWLLLLGRGGLSSLLLVLVVLLTTCGHAATPVLLGFLVLDPAALARLKINARTSGGTREVPNDTSEASGSSGGLPVTSAAPNSGLAPPPSPPPSPPGPQPAPSAAPTPDVVIDDSEVLYRGFASTTKPPVTSSEAPPTTTVQAQEALNTTAVSDEPSKAWSPVQQGRFCSEPELGQDTRPQGGSYDLDSSIGWHLPSPVYLNYCKKRCEELSDVWGCRYISWGGPVSTTRWCYIHRHCTIVKKVSIYQIHPLNYTELAGTGRRSLRRLADLSSTTSRAPAFRRSRPSARVLQARHQTSASAPAVEISGSTDWILWLTLHTFQIALGGTCVLLAILGIAQARLAARVALQACHESSLRQLRSLLAAPAAGASGLDQGAHSPPVLAPGSLVKGKGLQEEFTRYSDNLGPLRDVADADLFLPIPLLRCLSALAQSLAALLCAAVSSGRQAVPAVGLTVAVGCSIYIHRLGLPLLQQLRRFHAAAEAAAHLRVQHLAECCEVMRIHGRVGALCDEYEAFCQDAALAVISGDAAQRWVYSRVHFLIALLLGLMCFSVLTQAPTLPSELGLAVAAAALLQVALLPDVAMAAVKHGARMSHGLAALRRMKQLCRELPAEELESPALQMRLPTEREENEVKKGQAKLKARHGKVMLGDSLIERGTPEEQTAQLYDLTRLEREQSISVAGFPLEKVAADWPYFGAIEFQEVTMRYGPGVTPALQDCSLQLPACKAMLLVGPQGCGKSSLVRALLRLGELEVGRVCLDSVDVRCVGLSTLRGRIALVPQETFLFRGTWRDNLDPMGEFEEAQLNLVLRLTRFHNWLQRNAPGGLDEVIGDPAALGPAPVLLSLSRAFLRLLQGRSKLLVLDSTTCRLSVSSDADLTAIVLRYCRRRGVAVLQASRRLQQAPLYDEVAVMQGGRILEQGAPKKLWVKDGALRRMARDQGLDSSKLTKLDTVAARLSSVRGWEVSPQESPDWGDEFSVGMKKVRSDKEKKAAK
eukprot:TRINITY_DN93091_c0_g1_i1.p1 TRINITY_DN93091_c0_g1~~TRINITY_DN93091_c0_g1_i1.p1  ORF type:complete len:1261 (-),score=268.76 TRINITY_DN93091_c0_g1_i1:64-3846(-)